MLPWKTKPIGTNAAGPKKLAVAFEISEGNFKILDSLVSVEILSGKVAEVEEAAKAADDVDGDMALNRRKVNLRQSNEFGASV
jgi:hypothetical protein